MKGLLGPLAAFKLHCKTWKWHGNFHPLSRRTLTRVWHRTWVASSFVIYFKLKVHNVFGPFRYFWWHSGLRLNYVALIWSLLSTFFKVKVLHFLGLRDVTQRCLWLLVRDLSLNIVLDPNWMASFINCIFIRD